MAQVDDVFKIVEIEHAGRTYQIPRPNFGTEAAYSRHLKANALRSIAAVRGEVADLVYLDAVRSVTESYAAGDYDWGSRVWIRSLDNPANVRELAWLAITQIDEQRGIRREEVQALQREKGTELVNALSELMFGRTPPMPPSRQEAGATT